jgi:hypothetical protein
MKHFVVIKKMWVCVNWLTSLIPGTQRVETYNSLQATNKPGTVDHDYNPIYMKGISRRIQVWGEPEVKTQPLSKK